MKTNDLWDFTGGEPFLENPHVAIINPRRKRRKSTTMARTTRRRVNRPRKRRSTTRRKRANSYVMGGRVTQSNPPRRRRRRSTAVTRRRRTVARHNPAIMGVQLPPLSTVLWTGIGFVAPPMVEGFVDNFIPAEWTSTTAGKYAVRIGSVLGLTMLTRAAVGSKESREVAIGGGIYIATAAVADFMPDLIPGLQAYVPTTLSAYTPSTNTLSGGVTPLPSTTTHAARFNRFGN